MSVIPILPRVTNQFKSIMLNQVQINEHYSTVWLAQLGDCIGKRAGLRDIEATPVQPVGQCRSHLKVIIYDEDSANALACIWINLLVALIELGNVTSCTLGTGGCSSPHSLEELHGFFALLQARLNA
jgi:hypothetical protein